MVGVVSEDLDLTWEDVDLAESLSEIQELITLFEYERSMGRCPDKSVFHGRNVDQIAECRISAELGLTQDNLSKPPWAMQPGFLTAKGYRVALAILGKRPKIEGGPAPGMLARWLESDQH